MNDNPVIQIVVVFLLAMIVVQLGFISSKLGAIAIWLEAMAR